MMPVLLEHIEEPSTTDWQDLEKIHLDTPTDGFLLNTDQLQEWLKNGGWVMAGRFNDRIVGALLAKEVDGQVLLAHAGVRTITQRRGVMHQLAHFICRWAQQEKKTLRVNNCPTSLQPALKNRGFIQKDDHWLYLGNQG